MTVWKIYTVIGTNVKNPNGYLGTVSAYDYWEALRLAQARYDTDAVKDVHENSELPTR